MKSAPHVMNFLAWHQSGFHLCGLTASLRKDPGVLDVNPFIVFISINGILISDSQVIIPGGDLLRVLLGKRCQARSRFEFLDHTRDCKRARYILRKMGEDGRTRQGFNANWWDIAQDDMSVELEASSARHLPLTRRLVQEALKLVSFSTKELGIIN